MTISFTLGLDRIEDELVRLAAPGLFWLTADRQQDADVIVQQAIAAQQSTALISPADAAPAAPGPCGKISHSVLPADPRALFDAGIPSHGLPLESPFIIIFSPFTLWEKLSSAELNTWLQDMQNYVAAQQSALLIVTWGDRVNSLRDNLHILYRYLSGLSHLEWQRGGWEYHLDWWSYQQSLQTDITLRLTQAEQRFTLADNKPEAYSEDDAQLFLAEKNALTGPALPDTGWMLFEDNRQLAMRAQQAHAATVIFSLLHGGQVIALAGKIHSLRRNRGSALKIVLRERHTTLRYSDERLLLACGVNLVVPANIPDARFLAMLEELQGQSYQRHVQTDLAVLMKSMQPMQERGYLPPVSFCQSVQNMIHHTGLPEDGKGLLVVLYPACGIAVTEALQLCHPRRFGDLVTRVGNELYLFLSSCRYHDLDTALKFIFQRPCREIFSQRTVWYADEQILREVQQHLAAPSGDVS